MKLGQKLRIKNITVNEREKRREWNEATYIKYICTHKPELIRTEYGAADKRDLAIVTIAFTSDSMNV